MKSMKKCRVTENKISIINKLRDRRRSSAGMFYTSSAGAVTSLILCTMLYGVFSLSTGANQAHATASTITISVVDSVSLSILPTSTSGTFATSDTSTNNISVSTNNGTGYTLGIKASTEGSNTLINESDDTKTIPSHTIANGVSETSYNDDTYASTNNLNNTWGYRPSKYYDTASGTTIDNTSTNLYFPGPISTSTPFILDKTTSANSINQSTDELIPNNYNIAIGARIDSNTTSGTYSNTFAITAIANPIPYTITYNKNAGSDTVNNMPSDVDSSTYSETVTLSSNTPTRSGYTFAGWCTVAVNADANCSGKSYAENSDWTLDQTGASNTLVLYARWTINSYTCTKQYRLQNADGTYPDNYTSDGTEQVKFGETCSYTKNEDYYTSQTDICTITTDGCTISVSLPRTTYTLTVNRNTTYISSVSGAGTYRWGQSVSISAATTSSNFTGWSVSSGSSGSFASVTEASTTYTMPKGASAIYADGDRPYIQNFTKANCRSRAPSGNIWVVDQRDSQYYTVRYINGNCWMARNLAIGCNGSGGAYGGSIKSKSLNSTYSNVSSTWSTPTKLLSNASSSTNVADYSDPRMQCSTTYGAWYNYVAASAGSISGTSNTTTDVYNICPKGWTLPSLSQAKTISGDSTYTSAFSPVKGGFYVDGSLIGTSQGRFWSTTANGSTSRYYLGYAGANLYGSDSNIGELYGRFYSGYVRCVRSS